MESESEEEEAGEYYTDALTGARRRRRGSRRTGHGPMSGAEKNMSRTFQAMLRDLHWMDGELSDAVCTWIAANLAAYRTVLRKYRYEELPEPTVEDLARLLEELDIPLPERAPVAADDVDVYQALQ